MCMPFPLVSEKSKHDFSSKENLIHWLMSTDLEQLTDDNLEDYLPNDIAEEEEELLRGILRFYAMVNG